MLYVRDKQGLQKAEELGPLVVSPARELYSAVQS